MPTPNVPANLIYRYFVVGETVDGENLDFFVDALTPDEANTLWSQYVEGPDWGYERGNYERKSTWLVGPGGLERRVLEWDHDKRCVR